MREKWDLTNHDIYIKMESGVKWFTNISKLDSTKLEEAIKMSKKKPHNDNNIKLHRQINILKKKKNCTKKQK